MQEAGSSFYCWGMKNLAYQQNKCFVITFESKCGTKIHKELKIK
jgi:hypothetical protein